jgi:RimJ/RimL family protein N-acetyltransferase
LPKGLAAVIDRAMILADDGLDLSRATLKKWTRARLEATDRVFVGPAQGQGQWAVGVSELAWDSRIFGLGCGQIYPMVHGLLPGRTTAHGESEAVEIGRRTVGRALSWLKKRGVQFVSARIDGRDLISAHVLEAAGFRLMDISTIHRLDFSAETPAGRLPRGFRLRPAEPGDERRLAGLAAQAMTDTSRFQDRFSVDPVLAPGAARMYKAWWKNSVKGERADEVWVLTEAERPVGFITLTGPDPVESDLTGHAGGWVVLNGLASSQRGRGLYRPMVLKALRQIRARGGQSARVKTKLTQQAVQRTWQALGARLAASSLVFHRLLNPPAGSPDG